jgi:hypothetical protein
MKTLNLNRTINSAGDLSDGVLIGLSLKNMFVKNCLLYDKFVCFLVIQIILMILGYKNFVRMLEIIIE